MNRCKKNQARNAELLGAIVFPKDRNNNSFILIG